MIDDTYIKELLEYNKGTSLIALWLWAKKYPPFHGDLDMAKKGFFYIARKLMEDGILKLASDGIFWTGSAEDQLKRFEESWPKEYDSKVEEKDIDNLWWYIFAPAGAVWVYPESELVWT